MENTTVFKTNNFFSTIICIFNILIYIFEFIIENLTNCFDNFTELKQLESYINKLIFYYIYSFFIKNYNININIYVISDNLYLLWKFFFKKIKLKFYKKLQSLNKIIQKNLLSLSVNSICVSLFNKAISLTSIIFKFISLTLFSTIYNAISFTIKFIKLLYFILSKFFLHTFNIYIYLHLKVSTAYNYILSYVKIHYLTPRIVLELKIFIYNNSIFYKKFKYYLSLCLIYFLDNLEYHILINKKIYKRRNIVKIHKKIKKFKKFNSKIDNYIKLNFEIFINYLTKFIYMLTNLSIYIRNNLYNHNPLIIHFNKINNNGCILWITRNYSKKKSIIFKAYNHTYNSFKNLINCLNNNTKNFIINNITYINLFFKYLYLPFTILNYIISDIALSVTKLLILYKKKHYINIIIIFTVKFIFKLYDYSIFYFKKLYKFIKKIIFYSIRKTIYLVFIVCLFYNQETSQIIINDIYNTYLFDYLNKHNISVFFNFILNKNNFYFLTTILGLQLVIYWARFVHRFFGTYLWTMIAFPLFIEVFRGLYLKLFCVNFLYTNNFDYILLLRYNILELFNYKIYNIYAFLSNLILLLIILYCIKRGAFRHLYGNFKYPRWRFIKYPTYIYILELFRLKIVEYFSVFILYFNYKTGFNDWYLKTIINITNNKYFLIFIDFTQEYIYEIYDFKYYKLYMLLIPNLYLINFLIDLLIAYTALKWLLIYLNMYKKIDTKFVAFPLVTLEIIGKYILIYIITYHSLKCLYVWFVDGIIVWYFYLSIVFLYIYLEIRVHKVPRKTMPWYFRQIVELWPSTYLNQWYTAEYLYFDQQRYIVLRFRLKSFKLVYKENYKKLEIWNKIVILNYQKEKNKSIRLASAFCRLMARKENMLREINNFEYQGWYEDWQYNSHKINIYNWKLDFWDKPYFYQFKKTIFFSNVKFFSFDYRTPIERFTSKYMHLTKLFFCTNVLDFYYTQKYIYILDKDEISNMSIQEWKKKFFTESDELEELIHLKKLKIVLMGFSSGEIAKTPDWNFPYLYEKEYKKKGWAMFEDPRIDAVELDWRPDINDLN